MKRDTHLDDFLLFLNQKGYKPRGNEERIRCVKIFLSYLLDKGMSIDLISYKDAEDYREYLSLLINDGITRYSSKTINCTISHLKMFYNFLIHNSIVLNNPFTNINRLKESTNIPKKILSIEQMGILLNGIPVANPQEFKFKAIVETLYSTGARISELNKLVVSDINLDSGYITIKDDKNRQNRIAPLTDYCITILRKYLSSHKTLVFKTSESRSLNQWVNKRLKEVTTRLNLPVISCHCIRHTIATHLFQSGADIREVQEYLGHKRIKNTEVYTRIVMTDLKSVIQSSHPREIR